MTQIYICDDEPVWIEQIEQAITAFMISSNWAVTILCRSTRPAGLLDCLMQNQTLGGIYFLVKEDIYFVESQKNMHKLFVHMRSEVFTAAMPLKDMAKQLGDSFIFCRRIRFY